MLGGVLGGAAVSDDLDGVLPCLGHRVMVSPLTGRGKSASRERLVGRAGDATVLPEVKDVPWMHRNRLRSSDVRWEKLTPDTCTVVTLTENDVGPRRREL
ncbi:hypothetical protein GCM10010353_57990 [Streptomyces chryseus]|nr:hypothetical protein GCM10010353_57990 [Streptomyces chryseus]